MKKAFLYITMILLSCLLLTACKGHGQTTAPAETYTEKEEASAEVESRDKKQTEKDTSKSKIKSDSDDPFSIAITACCKYADVSQEDARDLKVKEIDKETYRVTFKSDGKDFDLLYNASTGEVKENR